MSAPDPVWTARLTGDGQIEGTLTGAASDSVLCFSMMGPMQAISGCTILRQVAGYTELQLTGDATRPFVIGFQDAAFRVFNVGWLPARPYIRDQNGSCRDVDFRLKTPPPAAAEPDTPPLPGGLRLVPKPAFWAPDGQVLEVGAGFHLPPDQPHAEAVEAVQALAHRNALPALIGGPIPVAITIAPVGGDEAYHLNITPGGVFITAASRNGVFYAAISLLTLITTHMGRLPCGLIKDAPRFSWRGQQLDCVRHYYQPDTLLDLLDLMALLKLNRFHWHFSDDEAFRLEVTSFPEIWQKTRFRGENCLIPGVFGGGQGPTGGSYSLDFARDLVARAADLAIEVLPEIEIPSHAYALVQVFPDLKDPADNSSAPSVQGYIDNTMNPAMPFTWTLTDALIDEVLPIFPFAHLHLGCDERPPEAWLKSPAAQDFMRRHGLKTADDLQAWTIHKAADRVRRHGARPCAWEEAAKGRNDGIGKDAILFSWTGQGPGLDAARKGVQVVMCPAQHAYWDLAISDDFHAPGGRWAGTVSLNDSVNWDPVPADEPHLEANILGVEGAFWGEFTLQDSDMKPMMVPRILGLAETAWRPQNDKATAASIHAVVRAYAPLLKRAGWPHLSSDP